MEVCRSGVLNVKELDLKDGDLIRHGGDIGLVILASSELDVEYQHLHPLALALFSDGVARYVPNYLHEDIEVVEIICKNEAFLCNDKTVMV